MASDGATVAALSRVEGIRYRLRLGGCGGAEGVKNKTICWELFRGLICRPKRAFSSWEIAVFPFKLSKHNFICLFCVSECHASCQSCSGGTNQDCDECKAGWEEDEQDACVGKTSAMSANVTAAGSSYPSVSLP